MKKYERGSRREKEGQIKGPGKKKESILYATMTEHQKNFQDHLINPEKHLVMNVSLGEGIWVLAGIWTSSESLMRNPHQISSQQAEVAGVSLDEAREKTVPAMDQWVTIWDQEFETPLTVPKLAMLVIEVKEFKRVTCKMWTFVIRKTHYNYE